ncbi:hypothetical protein HALLA_10590 [Halostagnicola larsenii XH-48]|uniref:Uncharacterized protein n=1 Tax=Halostagnicola larsenii XH-48 TaxID=797299 RepID=W0JKV5_9EURY|nr:hypothetical protein [Halostagnicola larsenii]AHF99233.1 hypothetical protein HALLA_10590 [Halostagnicola larsenii XH-48]
MKSRAHNALLFAMYQLCIVVGIAAMPLAIVANQIGLSLPVHRVLANVGEAYENARK